jgi:tetratricopeptide (TPR) repeat protein
MVLASSISDAGNEYRIEINALDCSSGKPIARARNDVANRNELIHQFGVAEAQLRKKLGEPKASLARFNKPLEEATSASPEALQAGLIGYKHHLAADFMGAALNYEKAIELDPKLALAYEALGAAYAASGKRDLEISAIKKAYELRDRLAEPNRLNADYEYFVFVTGEQEKALVVTSQLVETFPRDFTARVNLGHCLSVLGQPDRSVDQYREAARLFPNAFSYEELVLLSIYANSFNEAEATLKEADARQFDSYYLHHGRFLLAFLRDDQVALQEQWGRDNDNPTTKPLSLVEKSAVEGYYGRAQAMQELVQKAAVISDGSETGTNPYSVNFTASWAQVALYEANVGNFSLARKLGANALRNANNPDEQILLALALARAGDTENAQKLADVLDKQHPLDTLIQNYCLPTIRAAMRLNVNDPSGAVAVLLPALKYELTDNDSLNSVDSAYIRGLVYLQMGDGRAAATEFQKLLDHRGLVSTSVTGALAYVQMGRAQKMAGEEAAARKFYEEFLTLWKQADPDIPIYRQARTEYVALRKGSTGP